MPVLFRDGRGRPSADEGTLNLLALLVSTDRAIPLVPTEVRHVACTALLAHVQKIFSPTPS